MPPEDSDRLHTVLYAEQDWQDKNYSSTHKKIGIDHKVSESKKADSNTRHLSGVGVNVLLTLIPGNS